MINVKQLCKAENGSTESHSFVVHFPKENFPVKKAEVNLTLLKMKGGIVLMVDEIEFTQKSPCVRCETILSLPYKGKGGEWNFYEKAPQILDPNEWFLLDLKTFTLDPYEAIRQEVLLHLIDAPRCEKECKHFESGEAKVKSLAGLKDLIK